MEALIISIHVVVALSIVGLILIQQGKGAETGASFGGGASQTVFGSQGGATFFSKFIAALVLVFFVSSFVLAVIAKNKATVGIDSDIPSVESVDSVESELPSAPTPEEINLSDEVPRASEQVKQGQLVEELQNDSERSAFEEQPSKDWGSEEQLLDQTQDLVRETSDQTENEINTETPAP